MDIKTDTPKAEDLARLVPHWNETRAQHAVDAGARFVCGYDGDRLIGVLWYVGDGFTWVVLGIYTIRGQQGEGIGTALRLHVIKEYENKTMGKGAVYGWFERGKDGFWNSIPGTKINPYLAVASRHVDGKA
jgi:GNAT superfamily N-acetyltransferase